MFRIDITTKCSLITIKNYFNAKWYILQSFVSSPWMVHIGPQKENHVSSPSMEHIGPQKEHVKCLDLII